MKENMFHPDVGYVFGERGESVPFQVALGIIFNLKRIKNGN
jgi:hypothetical protein